MAPPPFDLDPWFLGDSWTFDTTILVAAPDGTTITTQLDLTTTVAEVRTETLGGLTYTVYNTSSSGSASATGVVFLAGANLFSVSGPLSGWSWADRSNLASVAVNQTTNMTGIIQVGIFTFPITIDAGATVRGTPAIEDYDFPLELGDAWSFDGMTNSTGAARITGTPLGPVTQDLSGEANASYRAWFNATEDVTVPAGSFLGAARLHAVSADGNATDRWFHPDAKNVVKMEVHRQSAPNDYFHLWTNLTAFSLVAPPPWVGTITLNPSRIDPGGSVLAWGAAGPNEDLLVSIPAIGATYPIRADGAGSWSLTLSAPLVDDFTPANADLGSHGVLVEPVAAPTGWDVATLQLVPPDLYAAAGDLVASDVAPPAGTLVTFNGTVHATVGTSGPFNVSFSVDGGEISRTVVPGIAANGSVQSFAPWTATSPGVHSVTFTVDPDDEVVETDEANNIVTITIFVQGPDLSPWNVAIEAETNATYIDPSAVGFVSAPTQGRIGGVVNVTFEAASVGAATVVDSFEVEVVETQGLWGPPIPGWRFSSNVTSPLPSGARAGPWTATWPVPSAPGSYHLNVTVDGNDQVLESFEANNTFVVIVTVSGPDYSLGGVVGPTKVTAAASVSLTVEVRNDGQLAGGIDVPFAAYEGASPTPFYSTNMASLSVGGNASVIVPWTSPSTATLQDLRFLIDPDNDLQEMDEANNEAIITVDVRDPPVTSIRVTGTNVTTDRLWVRGSTQFELAAQDFSGDGLTTYFRVDGGTTSTYAIPFSLSGDGAHSVVFWSEDNLSGAEVGHTFAATVDDSPPTTAYSNGEFTGNRTTVTLNSTDGSGAGVDRLEYRVDSGAWRTYTAPFLVEGQGDHTVEFHAVDLLGNQEFPQNRTLSIPPHSRPIVVPTNLKPFLAAAFAALLLVLALVPRPAEGYLRSRRFQVGVVFAILEAATGVASLAWRAFAIPPYTTGLAVDVGILLAGTLGILLLRRTRATDSGEPGTDK